MAQEAREIDFRQKQAASAVNNDAGIVVGAGDLRGSSSSCSNTRGRLSRGTKLAAVATAVCVLAVVAVRPSLGCALAALLVVAVVSMMFKRLQLLSKASNVTNTWLSAIV